MNSALVYPFDSASVSLISNQELLCDLKINKVVSPFGWGLVGKDAGAANDGRKLGINVLEDFESELEDVDTAFFVQPDKEVSLHELIYPKMLYAAKIGKNIISGIKIENDVKKEILEICNQHKSSFIDLLEQREEYTYYGFETHFSLNVPVVFVAGISERVNKFDIQLAVRKKFIEEGYRVSQIGTKNFCELMGFHSIPQFMYEKEFYEWEKIAKFNQYIKSIELREEPDVMIVGVPGGTCCLNNKFSNNYGMIGYEIAQAVVPDVTVLGLLYMNNYTNEYFYEISKYHKERYGFDISCFNVSNAIFNDSYSETVHRAQYTTVDYKFLSDKLGTMKGIKYPVFNCLDEDQENGVAENVLDKLADYGSYKV